MWRGLFRDQLDDGKGIRIAAFRIERNGFLAIRNGLGVLRGVEFKTAEE
ncbi:MAG TPA: hypothetical protein VGK80_11840 [Rhodanobacteraceae bacterium]